LVLTLRMRTMDPFTQQPTVRFSTMDSVDSCVADSTVLVADSTVLVVANSNTLVATDNGTVSKVGLAALKQAVKIAREKDWADVAAARTAALAAMLKTLKEKAQCWDDDVVVSPLTTLPGEKQVKYLFSYRASQGTTPLQLISSLTIASVSATDIIMVCNYY
jgi:hypothetical protein